MSVLGGLGRLASGGAVGSSFSPADSVPGLSGSAGGADTDAWLAEF